MCVHFLELSYHKVRTATHKIAAGADDVLC